MSVDDLEVLKSWSKDLRTIEGDVRSLLLGRSVFWEVQKIIEANPMDGNKLRGGDCYRDTAATGQRHPKYLVAAATARNRAEAL